MKQFFSARDIDRAIVATVSEVSMTLSTQPTFCASLRLSESF